MERIAVILFCLTFCCACNNDTNETQIDINEARIDNVINTQIELYNYMFGLSWAEFQGDDARMDLLEQIRNEVNNFNTEIDLFEDSMKRNTIEGRVFEINIGHMEKDIIDNVQNIYPKFKIESLEHMKELNFPIQGSIQSSNPNWKLLILVERLKVLIYIDYVMNQMSRYKLPNQGVG